MNSSENSNPSSTRLLSRRRLLLAVPGFSLLVVGAVFGVKEISSTEDSEQESDEMAGMVAGGALGSGEVAPGYPGSDADLETKFVFLSANGNSSCSQAFLASIPGMTEVQRLQGSCCSPMAMGDYREQIEALERFKTIELIPPDPYDIAASLAKKLLEYGKTITASANEQAILNKAVAASEEGDYCCCPCWRWSVYEG